MRHPPIPIMHNKTDGMKLRAWFKSRFADRALSPVREELVELIDSGSKLLEVGCGTGDLLFRVAPKITQGYGVDLDKEMINYAVKKKKKSKIGNITFACKNALEMEAEEFDICTSTLFLHELKHDQARTVLEFMVNNSKKVLIADFTSAKSIPGRVGIEVDELISGHYRNYRSYKESGEIPFLAESIGVTIRKVSNTEIDGIAIWKIGGKNCA